MKIKIYNSNVQRQAPLGKAMETPESLGAGVGRAGREFGDTTFNAFNEAEKKDQILKSNSDVSDFEVSQGQILADLKRDAPLDGSGVHEKFIAQYQKGREDLLKDKGAFYKDHAILRLDNMKSQFESSIIDYSARQNILKRSHDTDNFTENQAKMVRQNPAEFQARYDEAIRNIDSARLPPDVRLQHYDKAKKALKQAPVDHIRDMIATNPSEALLQLENEGYKDLLTDPQELLQLKSQINNAINNRKNEVGINRLVKKGSEGNRLFNKSLEEGLSLAEIQNNTLVSDPEKEALMKLSGYDSATFKQGQKSIKTATFQLELDSKIKETIDNANGDYPSIVSGKSINDTLVLRQMVYDGILNGDLSTEQGKRYMNAIIGSVSEEAESIAISKRKGKIQNPYVEGIKAVDVEINARSIEDGDTKKMAHNLFFEGLESFAKQENVTLKDFYNQPVSVQQKIQKNAIEYATLNIPNLTQAKEIFSVYLPSSSRDDAMKQYTSSVKADMSLDEKRKIAAEVVKDTQLRNVQKSNLSIQNALTKYNKEDLDYIKSKGLSTNDINFTAEKWGITTQEVIKKLKEFK